jgi:hypothetical protein
VTDIDGVRQYVLTSCFPAAEATPQIIKIAVKEIAYYGDWVEQRLTKGGDDL